jgi:hypothetical protein
VIRHDDLNQTRSQVMRKSRAEQYWFRSLLCCLFYAVIFAEAGQHRLLADQCAKRRRHLQRLLFLRAKRSYCLVLLLRDWVGLVWPTDSF